MKKLIFSFFITISFLAVLGTTKVEAAGWEAVSACRSDQMTPDSIRGYIKADSGEVTSIINNLNSKSVCVRNDITEFEVTELNGDTIKYCNVGQGKVVMRVMGSPGEYENFCCPVGLSLRPSQGGGCCPDNSTGSEYIDGVPEEDGGGSFCILPGGTRVRPGFSAFPTGESVVDDVQVFTLGTDMWQCPAEDCLTSLNGGNEVLLPNNTTLVNPFTDAQKNLHRCLPQGALMVGINDSGGNPIPADMFCAFQEAVTGPIATLLASNNDLSSCLELEGIEQQRCLECMGKNLDARADGLPESFVYSSIGCVDTRQDQFITRLFQIGLGTISGIAVIQIMWGMIERQSTDPAKIQQGRDRAIAALAALATVVGAIPILRFLGISVIQLLPNSFLG